MKTRNSTTYRVLLPQRWEFNSINEDKIENLVEIDKKCQIWTLLVMSAHTPAILIFILEMSFVKTIILVEKLLGGALSAHMQQ